MDGGLIDRIEGAAGRGASALFAGAVGYAAYGVGSSYGLDPQIALGAAGAGALAYLPCSRLLGVTMKHGSRFAIPEFELPELEFV